ncbi:MAG: hypothetical protein Q8T09_01760 [Candidatus Melainabacteria bacterium]|nr:hypothetical protein [Candidatus Melainabacteria bacterium]
MNDVCCQFHANFVVGSAQISDHSTEWYSSASLAAFNGRVIFFNSLGDSCWEYGIVHFRGDETVVKIAVKFAGADERTHAAIYPFHYQAQPGFIFRAASLAEYKDLCFSYEDFSADQRNWQIDCI